VHSPPILKRSKVEMTACSGFSGPLSGDDSESLSLRLSRDSALMFLDNRGPDGKWWVLRELSRSEA
jgi:hypothetical protein